MSIFIKRQMSRALWNIRNDIVLSDWPRDYSPSVNASLFSYNITGSTIYLRSNKFQFLKYTNWKIEIDKTKFIKLGDDIYKNYNSSRGDVSYLCYFEEYVIPIEEKNPILYNLVVDTFKDLVKYDEQK